MCPDNWVNINKVIQRTLGFLESLKIDRRIPMVWVHKEIQTKQNMKVYKMEPNPIITKLSHNRL